MKNPSDKEVIQALLSFASVLCLFAFPTILLWQAFNFLSTGYWPMLIVADALPARPHIEWQEFDKAIAWAYAKPLSGVALATGILLLCLSTTLRR